MKAIDSDRMHNTVAVESFVGANQVVKSEFKLESITSFNNFQFTSRQVKIWKQYQVGTGKTVKVTRQKGILSELTELTKSTLHVKQNKNTCTAAAKKSHDDSHTETAHLDKDQHEGKEIDRNDLFPCTEVGCMDTFSKFGNLQRHLDFGKHTYNKATAQSLDDRAKEKYIASLSLPKPAIPSLSSNPTSNASLKVAFSKGWALKERRKVSRFAPEVKEYLKEKFDEGETTGRKALPDDVAKEMRTLKKDGKQRFKKEHFLTETQISSYFSRLSQKKLKPEQVYNDLKSKAKSST